MKNDITFKEILKDMASQITPTGKWIMIIAFAIFIIICFMTVSCSYYPDDNFVEEVIEDYIYKESGIKVDFTGDSLED